MNLQDIYDAVEKGENIFDSLSKKAAERSVQTMTNPMDMFDTLGTSVKSSYPRFKEELNEAPGRALQDYAERIKNPNPTLGDAASLFSEYAIPGGAMGAGAIAMSDTAKAGGLGTVGGAMAKGFEGAKKAGRTWKGLEGKAKFEISDELAKLKKGSGIRPLEFEKLEDVLEHPQLYENYPEFRNVMIEGLYSMPEGLSGRYDPVRNEIGVAFGKRSVQPKSTLLHEIQHAIQEREGFAKGGSPKLVQPEELERIKRLSAGDMDIKNKLSQQLRQKKIDDYKNLAGEAESRNVQTRMNYTDEMRQENPFWKTFDVPEKEQIVRMKSGMMADVPVNSLDELAKEAKKYKSFDEFKKEFVTGSKHGIYYHITDNPNFKIDKNIGPRDMSSLASGEMEKGKLMITSHLENWSDQYKEAGRKYVAIIDMEDVNPKDYWQSNRGFGNELWVDNPGKAVVRKVVPIEEALKLDRKYQKQLGSRIDNEDDLRKFYDKVIRDVPKVLYRGQYKSGKFDLEDLKYSTKHGSSQLGFFFTPMKKSAQAYAGKSGEVISAKLDIRNPYTINENEFQDMYEKSAGRKFREKLINEGYDGAYYPDGEQWIAFYPEQITRIAE